MFGSAGSGVDLRCRARAQPSRRGLCNMCALRPCIAGQGQERLLKSAFIYQKTSKQQFKKVVCKLIAKNSQMQLF